MKPNSDEFALTVSVDADDWAYEHRRSAYLEAVVIQILRDKDRVIEWFSAAELAIIRLPGLPATKGAITRVARSQGWLTRSVKGRGVVENQYHFSSLPARAFDALLAWIVNMPEAPPPGNVEHRYSAMKKTGPATTAPAWVLPLMRIIHNGEAEGFEEALDELPDHLPSGVNCPSHDEAMTVLRRLGMVSDL